MQDEAVLALLTSMDAIIEKKTSLPDGRTTNVYIEMGVVLQHPDIVSDFAEQMAADFFADDIDVVVSGDGSGVLLAHEIAKQLEARHIPARYDDDGIISISSIFNIEKTDKVLIVDDVINTGNKIEAIKKALKKSGASIKGVVCVVDRAENPLKTRPEIKSLLALRLPVEGGALPETAKKEKSPASVKKTAKKKKSTKSSAGGKKKPASKKKTTDKKSKK